MALNRRQFLALIATTGATPLAGCGAGGSDGGDTGDSPDRDSGGGSNEDSEEEGSKTSDNGGSDNNEETQPDDITGTVQNSVAELEVINHEVTAVDPEVRIELELRNAGDKNEILFPYHNIDAGLFDADGNDILREQARTTGTGQRRAPDESGKVAIYMPPEEGAEPASYEITVNCDGTEYVRFSYCERE